MSDGESVQSGASSPTIDVGVDTPCITNCGVHNASDHNMQISPTRTSIRTTRAKGGVKKIIHNKSCDSCRMRKKKCDGLHPCSRCIGQTGQIICRYSPRKRHKPYRRRGEGTVGALSRDKEVVSRPCVARNGVRSRLRLKRCSLAPSPATGLVGLKENVFLGDYFHCLGFLSFTTQSCIRETMVRIMTSPAWGRRSEHHGGVGGGAQHHSDNATALVDSAPYSSQPEDPSMCIFWCACGLGALVRGRSVESVSSYAQMATDAMNLFCEPDTLGSTEALTILAYLNWRCGNEGLYKDYIERAARFLQESVDVDTASHIKELVDVIEGVKTLKALEECMNGDKLSSFCNEDSDPPQISEYATERDIYIFVMQSFRIYVNIFQAHVHANPCEAPFEGREGVARKGADSDVLVEGPKGQHQRGGTCTSAGSTFIVSFRDEILQKLNQYYFGFGRLEEAADRPGVRGGIGAALIHGILLFEKAAQDDYGGVFKRLSRFTELFERYPGLFQLASGTHKAHILSTAIMSTEDPRSRPLYDKLRNVYNSMHPPGFRPMPPFEEWCGMSQICDHLYCRTMEAIILSDGLTFRLPSARTRPIYTAERQRQHQSVYSRDILARDDVGIVSEERTGRSEMCGTFENRSMPMPVSAAAGSLSPDVAGTDPNPNHYSRGALAEGRVTTLPVSVRSGTVSPGGQDLPPVDSLLLLRNLTGDNYSEVMSQDEYNKRQTAFVSSTGVVGPAAGRTVEGEEEVTALPSGPGVILTSVSKRDIDALGSSDWLDTTLAMLPGE